MALHLGRIEAPDTRDRAFLLRAITPVSTLPSRRFYYAPFCNNQNEGGVTQCIGPYGLGSCVGQSVNGLGRAGPLVLRVPDPCFIYREARKIDPWPGEDYEGTSVRAGLKVLENLGYIESYHWAWDATQARDFVLLVGCGVFGIPWLDGMFDPDAQGFLQCEGAEAGGHAILCVGFDQHRDAFRLLNSWGRTWGQYGRCWLRRADANRLLQQGGEFAGVVEKRAA